MIHNPMYEIDNPYENSNACDGEDFNPNNFFKTPTCPKCQEIEMLEHKKAIENLGFLVEVVRV